MSREKKINTDEQNKTGVPAITVAGLRKAFGGRAILDDFSLTVRKDENVVVLGKSGAENLS